MRRSKRGKGTCTMVPDVPGTNEASEMFQKLADLVKNRDLSNYVYVRYLQPGIADQMDNSGYRRNKQGQHYAKDVYTFFEVGKMKNLLDPTAQSISLGFSDKNGGLIDFDAVDAYTKAQDFNLKSAGRVASVVSHGDKFNILIANKDSKTQRGEADVNRALVRWNALSEELTSQGLDINELNSINPQLVNPGNVASFVKNLNTYSSVPNTGFSVKDIQMLLALNKSVPVVQNLLGRGWGTLEETAQRVYDTLQSPKTTQTSKDFVSNVLDIAKKLPKLDRAQITKKLKEVTAQFEKTDESANIQKTLDDLNTKYGIDKEVLIKKTNDISSISDAFMESIMSLKRQIENIERKSGVTSQSEKLRNLLDRMSEELSAKQNAYSLAEFMNTAIVYTQRVNNILDNVSSTGTNLEYARNIADATSQATNLKNAYYNVVQAISNIDSLTADFSITDTDKQTLKNLANDLKSIFDSLDQKVDRYQKEAMYAIGKEFIGEHNSLYGKDLVDIINMMEADTTATDYLYSIGRSSSTVISMLGAIIRDAQTERDAQLQDIALEIRRATHLLTKDGKDSRFMYDGNRIISQYDWDAYFKARGKYIGQLTRAGFKKNSFEFLEQMKIWEDQNTTEIEVDPISHRTEKVPVFIKTENFREGWSAAQNEYYDRMMALKGRIGTLLPNYAQHQFVAPQKRTSWDQVVKEGILGDRNFRNVFSWLLHNSNVWKMKEGTNKFRKNGIYLDGEEVIASTSTFDSTVLRQIPLFFVKKIDEGNLSHDFSSALQSLASTALNYYAMDNIKNMAELMNDYVSKTPPADRSVSGQSMVDYTLTQSGIGVAKILRKSSEESNTSSMLDAFVLKHIYGMEHKGDDTLWSTICMNLIGYTSFKGLAVNVKGALTNKFVGIIQSLIRATGGQYYNLRDLARAEAVLLGANGGSTSGALLGGVVAGLPGAAVGLGVGTALGAVGTTGKLMDILTNNRNSKDTLISEFFDASQESFSSLADQRYHSTVFGRLFGSFNPMAMYSRGEYWIHMLNVYATLFHEKVVSYDPETGERKIIPLYNALEKGEKIDGNTELRLASNIYRMDGKRLDALTDEYFKGLRRRIRYINQQCHGAMNKEDKGLIHQWMLGKMTMNFRQWMVEHYSSRFRKLHWDESIRDINFSNFYNHTAVRLDGKKVNLIDALEMEDSGIGDGSFKYKIKEGATTVDGRELTEETLDRMLESYAEDAGWRRGFKNDALQVFFNYIKDRQEYQIKAAAYWDTLSETQKADVKQVLGASGMFLMLAGLSGAMGDPDDHKGEFFYRLWMYVVKRCLFDERAASVFFIPFEAKTLINNPIASTQTVAGLLYPILGLKDINDTIKTGRYAGWNKYTRNILKYTIPFYSQIDQLLNIAEDSGVYQVFDSQITR